jgi:hypothetical protein
MQNNIDIIGPSIRRNVLQPKSQPLSFKIDNQRPFGIIVAVSAHNRDRRTDRAQFIQNDFRANITQMPDLVRPARKIDNFLRQLVMSVCQDENLHSTNSRTTNTTGTKVATSIFVVTFVTFVRGLI